MTMMYREAIQLQVEALRDIYNNVNALCDYAEGYEKKAFNSVQRLLPSLLGFLQELDDALTDDRANMRVDGVYSIIVTNFDYGKNS